MFEFTAAISRQLQHRPETPWRRNLCAFGGLVMMRTAGFVCCAFLLACLPMLASTEQEPAPESTPVTRTATIEAIDKATRTITLKGPTGKSVEIKAPEAMEGFNSLKVGDQVTATYFSAIALNLRKPGDPAAAAPPVTTKQRKERTPGSETRREQTFTGTVEAIDAKAPSVTVKGAQGRVVPLALRDASQLENVRIGDTVDVTFYESLLIKVARPSK